ncbi:hypothetical protein Pmar_PMAR004150, partial [Perkinsus marinus ATCC 50983]
PSKPPPNFTGTTALHVAAEVNNCDAAALLILHRADVNAKEFLTEMMRLLLASGADCEARDNEGHNALWWAQNVGSTEAADILRGPPWNSVEGSMTHEEQTAHVLKTRELLGMKPLVIPKKRGKKGKAKGKSKATKKK